MCMERWRQRFDYLLNSLGINSFPLSSALQTSRAGLVLKRFPARAGNQSCLCHPHFTFPQLGTKPRSCLRKNSNNWTVCYEVQNSLLWNGGKKRSKNAAPFPLPRQKNKTILDLTERGKSDDIWFVRIKTCTRNLAIFKRLYHQNKSPRCLKKTSTIFSLSLSTM